MKSLKPEVDFIRGKSGTNDESVRQIKQKKTTSGTAANQLFEVRKRKNKFQSETKPKKPKRKPLKNNSEDVFDDNEKVVIESMSLSRLPEGIVVYGCIQEISDFDVKLSVCGGIVATVSITNISNSYTLLLESFARNESLVSSEIEVLKPNGMFKIGQYFPIKILSKSDKTKGFASIDIKASLNPKDLYSDLRLSSLLKVPQMAIIAAVDSIEDHGFVMDIGFDDMKAFLPKEKAQLAIRTFKGRQSLCVGQLVVCAIDSVNDRTVSLTTKYKSLSEFKLTSDKHMNVLCLTPGLTVWATVMNVTEKGLVVLVLNELKGFVTRSHLRNDWDLPKNMYKIGDKVEGIVLYKHPITKQIALSLKPKLDVKAIDSFMKKVKIGTIYSNAIVMGRDGAGNFVFKLPDGIKAISHKRHLFDNDSEDTDLDTKYSIGSKHRCRVKAINLMDVSVVVTLRQSLIDFPTISVDDLQIGTIIRGKVKKLCKNGVVVQIGFGIRGFLPDIHLAEAAQIKSREQLFPKDKIIKCRIFKMDKSCTPVKVSLTRKKSLLNKKLNILSSYEKAVPGFETDAVVVLIIKSGILVEFFNDIRGFIPTKYLSTYRIESPENIFKLGQIVRCSVVATDSEKERITCSLIKIKDKKKSKQNKNKIVKKETNNETQLHEESIEVTQLREEPDEDIQPEKIDKDTPFQEEINEKTRSEKLVLKIDEPFVWNVNNSTKDDPNSTISGDSDSDDTIIKNKSRKERNEETQLREETLRKKEELLMDTERVPETQEDLERSVLASPNSSLVWLKYMAFYLERTDINKARAVAERGIKTISFREEMERLNVWVAYLNLENIYGTPQTLKGLFERALQFNEPVVIYRHLATIYANSNKEEETESLFNTMIKKFKQNKNVWIDFGLFYMKNNRLESARKLLQRSLSCLQKREHIEIISKFAQMEFKWGDVEQAKTLFENLLTNFPKRIDLWSVYIDMMLKYALKDNKEAEDSVRNIFERLITFKLSAKQMKFVFKRYIDFEKQFNNFERIERIKQKAMEYVEGKTIS